jgi:hypothetical protein
MRGKCETRKCHRDYVLRMTDNRSAKLCSVVISREDAALLGDRGRDGGSKFNGVGTSQDGPSSFG